MTETARRHMEQNSRKDTRFGVLFTIGNTSNCFVYIILVYHITQIRICRFYELENIINNLVDNVYGGIG